MSYESRAELASKIDYEGGLVEAAFFYGINTDEMPEGDEELTEAWEAMRNAWAQFEPTMHRVQDLLPDPSEYDDEGF